MIIEIKIPSPGESVTEVEIGRWLVKDGSIVAKGEEIAEVESDKATLTIVADASGKIAVVASEGETLPVGSVACTIDTSFSQEIKTSEPQKSEVESAPEIRARESTLLPPPVTEEESAGMKITAVAREMMKENHLSVDDVLNGLKRIGKREVEAVLRSNQSLQIPVKDEKMPFPRETVRTRMSMLRRKLSERLVSVKNETAMLTTFNEVDMHAVFEIRKRFQQKFVEKYGFKLGFMSFFVKASALAAFSYPSVNSLIDGEEIVTPGYMDAGIAVQTPKGLMVPIIRNAESKSVVDIEREIKELAERARNKKISIEELTGGTFTITNGGVFGSLLSTPIMNPPQSAILGMHNIVERPVAIAGKVDIRPMMYVALSYDHRIIDGRDSVGFLVKVRELIENPERMMNGGKDPVELLLGL
jgi:2-oxoglutarate dehydrogenase E2 component (dihydrolipoamide succinyltransferase)